MPGNPGSVIGGEKGNRLGDVFGLAQAAERVQARQPFGAVGIIENRLDERGADKARADAVDADAAGGIIHGHVAGERDDGSF